jgi:hypothetical protein
MNAEFMATGALRPKELGSILIHNVSIYAADVRYGVALTANSDGLAKDHAAITIEKQNGIPMLMQNSLISMAGISRRSGLYLAERRARLASEIAAMRRRYPVEALS